MCFVSFCLNALSLSRLPFPFAFENQTTISPADTSVERSGTRGPANQLKQHTPSWSTTSVLNHFPRVLKANKASSPVQMRKEQAEEKASTRWNAKMTSLYVENSENLEQNSVIKRVRDSFFSETHSERSRRKKPAKRIITGSPFVYSIPHNQLVLNQLAVCVFLFSLSENFCKGEKGGEKVDKHHTHQRLSLSHQKASAQPFQRSNIPCSNNDCVSVCV